MISNDDYSKLLDQQFETKTNISANKIISGTILKVSDQFVTVDIGYKSEGQIPKEEFLNTGSSDDLKEGQAIEVFIEKLEDREGNVRLSHEKAIKMKSWEKLQKLYDNMKNNSKIVCDDFAGITKIESVEKAIKDFANNNKIKLEEKFKRFALLNVEK